MAETITAVIVHPDSRVETVDIEPTLNNLKAAIGGGWLEGINGHAATYSWFGYCDEEGKVKGLPLNLLATTLASHMGWTGAGMGDYLCGPVIFVGPPLNSHDTSVPAELLEFVSEVVR